MKKSDKELTKELFKYAQSDDLVQFQATLGQLESKAALNEPHNNGYYIINYAANQKQNSQLRVLHYLLTLPEVDITVRVKTKKGLKFPNQVTKNNFAKALIEKSAFDKHSSNFLKQGSLGSNVFTKYSGMLSTETLATVLSDLTQKMQHAKIGKQVDEVKKSDVTRIFRYPGLYFLIKEKGLAVGFCFINWSGREER